jgi:hypothetical protein
MGHNGPLLHATDEGKWAAYFAERTALQFHHDEFFPEMTTATAKNCPTLPGVIALASAEMPMCSKRRWTRRHFVPNAKSTWQWGANALLIIPIMSRPTGALS